jgi:hypothetical protein
VTAVPVAMSMLPYMVTEDCAKAAPETVITANAYSFSITHKAR